MANILKYKGYTGTVETDFEDDCLHGVIDFITDNISYSATSPKELENEFKAAVDDYINTCKVLGREPQKPFSGTFNIRIGPLKHKQAAVRSKLLGISLNEFVKEAIDYRLMNENYSDEFNEKHFLVDFGKIMEFPSPSISIMRDIEFSVEDNITTELGDRPWTKNPNALPKRH